MQYRCFSTCYYYTRLLMCNVCVSRTNPSSQTFSRLPVPEQTFVDHAAQNQGILNQLQTLICRIIGRKPYISNDLRGLPDSWTWYRGLLTARSPWYRNLNIFLLCHDSCIQIAARQKGRTTASLQTNYNKWERTFSLVRIRQRSKGMSFLSQQTPCINCPLTITRDKLPCDSLH